MVADAQPVRLTGGDAARELGIPGRIVVGLVVAAGLVVAVPSGIGLLWFVPFASVGALLVIRRPRTSIGWLLLALAWAHALAVYQLDAAAPSFEDGSLSALQRLVAFAMGASAGCTFVLYAWLAAVFPSGRFPDGRWGWISRASLMVAAGFTLIGALAPRINVNLPGYTNGAIVRNPFGLLPDVAAWSWVSIEALFFGILIIFVLNALSLVVRFRRADGIERQQFRWISAAIAFVVAAIGAGLLMSTLIPGSADSGLAWIPAIVAFPTVAIAIGIAVLRYRLYEIDTIINRTIVYGLLTAILAGGSAAAIAVAEQLFQGVIGPGSDVTIVLTTLIVVTAFEPVKNAIKRLVDRWFAAAPRPSDVLGAFVDEVRGSISRPETERLLRRFLDVAMRAYRATGGEIRVETGGRPNAPIRSGATAGVPSLRVSASAHGLRVALDLFGGDPTHEAAVLEPALAAALAEVAPGS